MRIIRQIQNVGQSAKRLVQTTQKVSVMKSNKRLEDYASFKKTKQI